MTIQPKRFRAASRAAIMCSLLGMTGRASGPHLDWRMNWLDRRVDPQRLVSTSDGRTSP